MIKNVLLFNYKETNKHAPSFDGGSMLSLFVDST